MGGQRWEVRDGGSEMGDQRWEVRGFDQSLPMGMGLLVSRSAWVIYTSVTPCSCSCGLLFTGPQKVTQDMFSSSF